MESTEKCKRWKWVRVGTLAGDETAQGLNHASFRRQ